MGTPDGAVNEGIGQDNNSGGVNPAWNDMLNVVPNELHSQVIPHLRNWDQNFQRVQSEYKPYQEFKDAEISPEQIRMGMGLMQAIENNPQQVYELLGQQFNLGSNNTTDQGESEETEEFANLPPEIQEQLKLIPQLQQQLQTVTDWAVGRQNASAEAEEDAQLENVRNDLKERHGEFDEHFVLSKMYSGLSPEDAVAEYNSFVEKIMTEAQRPKAPKILGSGSIIPGEQGLDVKKMDPKQTKDLVVQMLRNSASQNR